MQYSLPCGNGTFNTPTTGKKIAWGTTSFYGTSLTGVYDGQQSFAFNGFPASHKIAYSVCVVLGKTLKSETLTQKAAATYAKTKPKSDCAATVVP